MLNKILLSLLLTCALSISGQLLAGSLEEAVKEQAMTAVKGMQGKMTSDQAIADAKAAQKKAASVDGEWRDVDKFIKSAEAAAKEGDHEMAIALANKARDHGELGYAQAVEQTDVKMPAYLTQ
jgi:hypothetical protein